MVVRFRFLVAAIVVAVVDDLNLKMEAQRSTF